MSLELSKLSVFDKEVESEKLIQMVRINEVFSEVLQESAIKMASFSHQVDNDNKIPNFGIKAAELMNDALEIFDERIDELSKDWKITTRKRKELEAILDTSLSSIFLKQLSILRELAINQYKMASVNEDVPADFVFFTVDSFYMREAEESVMPGSYWNYSFERVHLHNVIREISTKKRQLIMEKIQHAEHQANAFQYLQIQQAQIQAMQQQYGGSSGNWNIGLAYRPPNSNLNISMGYQQGKTNVQISMIPDEQAGFLGANGFTSGVGPANLGISINLNI